MKLTKNFTFPAPMVINQIHLPCLIEASVFCACHCGKVCFHISNHIMRAKTSSYDQGLVYHFSFSLFSTFRPCLLLLYIEECSSKHRTRTATAFTLMMANRHLISKTFFLFRSPNHSIIHLIISSMVNLGLHNSLSKRNSERPRDSIS